MKSFLITFKPATENPKRGWPLKELQKLARRNRAGESVVEDWRFHNRKDIGLGDRVFLLLQGKRGPAVIGYGKVARKPKINAGKAQIPVQFEILTDPSTEVLANKEDLASIAGGQRVWRTQSSGVLLPGAITDALEAMVVGKSPKPINPGSASNPDWTRDELILALDFYLKYRPNPPGKDSKEINELSRTLNRLGDRLFPPAARAATFRNANGVYMKLMNFRRLDPQYTTEGKTGLARGAKAEEEVWVEFANDATRCRRVAEAIVESLDVPETGVLLPVLEIEDAIQEAPEGRLLTRMHLARERNRKLVETKRRQAMKRFGKLACEVCGFDFSVRYGDRGNGFIECHHTKPVATLADGQKTHIRDLVLVCANCHRMIHRRRPWLSVNELNALVHEIRPESSTELGC